MNIERHHIDLMMVDTTDKGYARISDYAAGWNSALEAMKRILDDKEIKGVTDTHIPLGHRVMRSLGL